MIPLLLLIAVIALGFWWVRRQREVMREQLRQSEFPEAWAAILEENVPLYHRFPDALRRTFEQDICIFVHEKNFVGCAGLEITDEVRVTIAAQACILTLNQHHRHYPRLLSIYVYPSTYVATRSEIGAGGSVTERNQPTLGESWKDGRVALAWDAVRHGATNLTDGRNVGLHEFAHQLDQADGESDGVPVIHCRELYATWIDVLGSEYALLRRKRRHVVDRYGATNPAEFFATATEAFFEKPKVLRLHHPELFEVLKSYYRVDPSEWVLLPATATL